MTIFWVWFWITAVFVLGTGVHHGYRWGLHDGRCDFCEDNFEALGEHTNWLLCAIVWPLLPLVALGYGGFWAVRAGGAWLARRRRR